jgi:hypothetical protein
VNEIGKEEAKRAILFMVDKGGDSCDALFTVDFDVGGKKTGDGYELVTRERKVLYLRLFFF